MITGLQHLAGGVINPKTPALPTRPTASSLSEPPTCDHFSSSVQLLASGLPVQPAPRFAGDLRESRHEPRHSCAVHAGAG